MYVEAWATDQPFLELGGLVGRHVVEHEVDDEPSSTDKLILLRNDRNSIAWFCSLVDVITFSRRDIKGRERVRGPDADVVMALTFGAITGTVGSGPARFGRGPSAGLLVDTQHDGALWRVQICTTSRTFSTNSGSFDNLNVSTRCRSIPIARHTRDTAVCVMPVAVGHPPCRPVRCRDAAMIGARLRIKRFVNGHEFFPVGGQRDSPRTAMVFPRA